TVSIGGETFIKAYEDAEGGRYDINDNIVTATDLQPINLNTIGGTAQETTGIRIGANLPATDDIGETHKTNVVIYDTLGNSSNLELKFIKDRENAWGLTLDTPPGAATTEIHGTDSTDDSDDVFAASGLITFTSIPADGETIIIDGITFEFDTDTVSSVTETATLRRVDISSTSIVATSDVPATLKTAIDASDLKETSRFTTDSSDLKITQSVMGDPVVIDVSSTLAVQQIAANSNSGAYTVESVDFAYKNGLRMDFDSSTISDYNNMDTIITTPQSGTAVSFTMHTPKTATAADNFTVNNGVAGTSVTSFATITAGSSNTTTTHSLVFTDGGAGTDTIVGGIGSFAGWQTGDLITVAGTTGATNDFATTAVTVSADFSTLTFVTGTFGGVTETLTATATITNTSRDAADATITPATATFGQDFIDHISTTVSISGATDTNNIASTVAVTSATSSVLTLASGFGAMVADSTDSSMTITLDDETTTKYVDISGATLASDVATALRSEIIAASQISTTSRFTSDGSSLIFLQSSIGDDITFNMDGTTADGGAGTVSGSFKDSSDTLTLTGTLADGVDADLDATSYGSKKASIDFQGDGLPSAFNTDSIDVQWANGSNDMEGDGKVALFLGDPSINNGMTQFAGSYQINFITQNGAQFGNFAGVSVGSDGVVTALFDNGVTRPVFMVPVATFVNPNSMSALSGNVYIETDFSGTATVREAGEGGAGDVTGASLESSTVDLGEEFTQMIITQRAYSAAAKIITTADEMLDELLRIK
ncbi:MAG: flagellar hook-basal body complex protein, partial [Rhodospirillales bacterium]|nr:flagellar hook-basal body complex protein [Rhodospirillales bacterium]